MVLLGRPALRGGGGLVIGGLVAALVGCASTPSPTRASGGTVTPAPVVTGTPSTATASPVATSPGSAATTTSAARQACERIFGSAVGSAGPATVGDIRRSGGGPAAPSGVVNEPAAHAFGHQPDSALGAWCWVGDGNSWTLYGIDMHGEHVAMYTWTDWSDPAPPTPPAGSAYWF